MYPLSCRVLSFNNKADQELYSSGGLSFPITERLQLVFRYRWSGERWSNGFYMIYDMAPDIEEDLDVPAEV